MRERRRGRREVEGEEGEQGYDASGCSFFAICLFKHTISAGDRTRSHPCFNPLTQNTSYERC